MKKSPVTKQISFQSKLESISDEMEYYAVPVPAAVTKALGTNASIAIMAQINDFAPFRGSLYTVGEGRHAMRVKASVRKDTKIKEGDRVRVKFTVVDRSKEAADLPKDLISALKSEGVLDAFKSIPPGQRSFILRKIADAAKPETRAKRIQEAVGEAYKRKEKQP